jgi:hypothetical protein
MAKLALLIVSPADLVFSHLTSVSMSHFVRLQLTYFLCLYAALDFISLDAIFLLHLVSFASQNLGCLIPPFLPVTPLLIFLYCHICIWLYFLFIIHTVYYMLICYTYKLTCPRWAIVFIVFGETWKDSSV